MDTLTPTRTPGTLTPGLREACKRLAPAEPVFVAKRPFPGARINKCTYNVREFLRQQQGEMILGWEVTVWDNVMLDCIGHAVVRHGESLLCVTPSKYGDARILFLPDSSLRFDFDDENARMPVAEVQLSQRPEVARLIEATRSERSIKIKIPSPRSPWSFTAQTLWSCNGWCASRPP